MAGDYFGPICTCGRTTSGGSLCEIHGTSWFGTPASNNDDRPFPVLSPLIPKGDYCYTSTGRVVIDNRVLDGDEYRYVDYYFKPENKVCSFWKSTGNGDAFCAYLGVHSSKEGCNNLIWDQVKECGVNGGEHYDLFELEEGRNNGTPYTKSVKRSKLFPQFMESLISLLVDSETNELTYDGVTYTLSQHIYDSLN